MLAYRLFCPQNQEWILKYCLSRDFDFGLLYVEARKELNNHLLQNKKVQSSYDGVALQSINFLYGYLSLIEDDSLVCFILKILENGQIVQCLGIKGSPGSYIIYDPRFKIITHFSQLGSNFVREYLSVCSSPSAAFLCEKLI